jgi:hypothetical protein
MYHVFVMKGVVKSTRATPKMVRLMIHTGEMTPIQLLYHQGARANIPSAVRNTRPLGSGHGIDGIDPPLVDLQEQINDSAREGRHLGGE